MFVWLIFLAFTRSKSVSSLLDLDDLITGPTSHGSSSVLEPEPSLPPPLLPSLFNLDPMCTWLKLHVYLYIAM